MDCTCAGTSHRSVQQLDQESQEEPEADASGGTSGDHQRTVRPVRTVWKVRRLDERKTLGALLIGKPSAALRLHQAGRHLTILLP